MITGGESQERILTHDTNGMHYPDYHNLILLVGGSGSLFPCCFQLWGPRTSMALKKPTMIRAQFHGTPENSFK